MQLPGFSEGFPLSGRCETNIKRKTMFYQSKKVLPWEAKDYGRVILFFVLHTFILLVLFFLALLSSFNFVFQSAFEWMKEASSIRQLLYSAIAINLISVCLFLYYYYEGRDFILRTKNVNLVFVILELSIIVMYMIGKFDNVYARPFALCALLSLLLISRKSAVFLNTVVCLLMFVFDAFGNSNPFEGYVIYSSLIIGYTTSLLSVYLVAGIRSRLTVFLMGFVIAVPVCVCCICLEFDAFLENPFRFILYGFTSGLLSVVGMMAFLPFFERIFNVLTDYRLSEITDHKSTLIKMLIQQAPGTFNHSLVVSTLAESCANAIGENALLARACAYYHDIGKLKNPEFFTENQQGYNPHNELSPELSTDIIRAHAKDGYDLIRKYHLPQILADVALQHHGTLPIRFFYAKAQKFTEGDLDIANFSYPGPKPQTKLAAIIMLADGCEAKVRTLPDRSHAKVDAAVREIIEERMDFDQFSECELTMKDIDIIRRTITNALAGVYHDRVEYPKLRIGGKH